MSKLKNLTKVRVLAYHNYSGSKYEAIGMKNTLPDTIPTEEMINDAVDTIKKYGITVLR